MESDNTTRAKQTTKEVSLKEIYLDLRTWLRYLFSKWIIIVIFGIIGGALGFIYAYSKKPVYTAITSFVLEDDKGSGGGLGSFAGIASMAGIDLGSGGGGIFQGDNIIELYKSHNMIRKALLSVVDNNGAKVLLIDRYIAFNQLREAWAKDPKLKDLHFYRNTGTAQFTRLQDSIIGVIVDDVNKHYLTVYKPDKKLSIIKAEVKTKDEFFAKNFNEQIVRNVNEFYIQTKTKKSAENVTILQKKTDSVTRVMNGAIYKAAVVTDVTPNLNPSRLSQRTVPLQRSQFSAEANKAVLSTLLQNLEMAKLALLKEKPLIQVVDGPVYPLPKTAFGKAKGIIIGGVLFGFLAIIVLLMRKFLNSFFNEP